MRHGVAQVLVQISGILMDFTLEVSGMGKPVVFISHRHADKDIADVVKKHLLDWGIIGKNIFQSSDPRRASMHGQNLIEYLKSKLEKTNLFILIYTHEDEDWQFPMWEAGVVQGGSTVNTRLVVFQCTEDEPEPFKGLKRVRLGIGLEEVRSFAEDFHKTPGFIPSEDHGETPEEGFLPGTPDNTISDKAKRFYNDLLPVLPGAREDKHLWDFIRLRLEPEYIDKIRDLGDGDEAIKILKDHLELRKPRFVGLGYNVNTAVRQFGFAGYAPKLKLSDLIEKWDRADKTGESAWIKDLYTSISCAVTNTQPPAVSHPFKSVREGVDWWFFVPVTRMRVNRDRSLEFDVCLIRLPPGIHFSTESREGK